MSYTHALKASIDKIQESLTKVTDDLMDEVQTLQMGEEQNSNLEAKVLYHLEKAEGYFDYASYQLQLAKRIMK